MFDIFLAAEDDFQEVMAAVIDLVGSWTELSDGLGLLPKTHSAIEEKYPKKPRACLRAVLIEWLRRNHNIEKYGHPSWRTLVQAIANPIGCNDTAMALRIAQNHPGR